MKTEHLTNFSITGFTYYDGALVFKHLKIGKSLKLKLEEDNKYDPRAIAIYYKEHKIGFIPRSENRIIYKLMKVGLIDNLRIIIQQINPQAEPEQQIRIVIHLIKK